jgi:putative flippase GtrA
MNFESLSKICTDSNKLEFLSWNLVMQFICFTGVGAFGTAVHYLILIGLVQVLKVNSVLGSGVGFIGGAMVNYALNYRFVFRSSKQHHKTIIKFFMVAMMGFFINILIMFLMTRLIQWNYLYSQFAATAVVLCWTFIGNKVWTFREVIHVRGTEILD